MAGKSLRRRLTDTFITAAMRPPLGLPRLGRPDVELRGKKVLLTGASSGIGAAATEKFAAAGAEVIAVARRGDLLDELATRIGAAGGQIRTAVCDVTDMDAVDALVEEVGAVDILVNNAGRSIRRPLAESLERWHDVERTMAVNYYAPMRLMRGFVPGMLERGDGHIINVLTWGVMNEAAPLFGAYNASKSALASVSRVADTEWTARGVHCTGLYYPLVATPMISPTRAYDDLPALSAAEAADWMLTAARTRPIRIAPRMAVTMRAFDVASPSLVTEVLRNQWIQPTPMPE
ncbi:MAG: SDR family oxidoreductase [Mycobacterium sp.]|nr:SDR family oxidoreductase [Mycobacterium sp.]